MTFDAKREAEQQRFVVVHSEDAHGKGWHHPECKGPDADRWKGCGDHWELYDTATTPATLVGIDGGEPEDQLLVRDWDWVVVALNSVAKSAHAQGIAEGEKRGRVEGIKEAQGIAEDTYCGSEECCGCPSRIVDAIAARLAQAQEESRRAP